MYYRVEYKNILLVQINEYSKKTKGTKVCYT